MLALEDSAGRWKAETGPKLTAKGIILDDSMGRVFYAYE
jgi:hypothetical protein